MKVWKAAPSVTFGRDGGGGRRCSVLEAIELQRRDRLTTFETTNLNTMRRKGQILYTPQAPQSKLRWKNEIKIVSITDERTIARGH
jgi:hypothetical protein